MDVVQGEVASFDGHDHASFVIPSEDHARRQIKENVERLVDIDGLSACADRDLRLALHELALCLGDNDQLKMLALRDFYWGYWQSNHITAQQLAEAFDVKVKSLPHQVGISPDLGFRCRKCDAILLAVSRSHAAALLQIAQHEDHPEREWPKSWPGHHGYCEDCRKEHETEAALQARARRHEEELEAAVLEAEGLDEAEQEIIRRARELVARNAETVERIRQSREMPYEEYLQTPHARELAESTKRNAGYKCQLDGRSDLPLHLHHNSYERLGQELPEDVLCLCELCHTRFHDGGAS